MEKNAGCLAPAQLYSAEICTWEAGFEQVIRNAELLGVIMHDHKGEGSIEPWKKSWKWFILMSVSGPRSRWVDLRLPEGSPLHKQKAGLLTHAGPIGEGLFDFRLPSMYGRDDEPASSVGTEPPHFHFLLVSNVRTNQGGYCIINFFLAKLGRVVRGSLLLAKGFSQNLSNHICLGL